MKPVFLTSLAFACAATAARAGDNRLQFKPGDTLKASHGFGYLGRHAILKL
jgi:hypothetical protein